MTEYLIQGHLAENSQTMDFPAMIDGQLKPWFRAGYHEMGAMRKGYYRHDKDLVYLAVPKETLLEFDEQRLPVPFIEKGAVKDVRQIKLSPTSLITDGVTLVKMPPNTGFKVKGNHGDHFHSFQWLETPDSYRDPSRMHFDFVYKDEPSGLNFAERGDRIIRIGKVIIFPDYCAYRLPGWLAKEFNGSPEFGFAYSRFTEPRPGEILHSHQEVMEPYIGLEGDIPLFVEMEGGSETLSVKDTFGADKEYRGEVVNIGKGDVVLPLPFVPHRILFDERAKFPFTQYCINYSARGLDKTPSDDRVLLEK